MAQLCCNEVWQNRNCCRFLLVLSWTLGLAGGMGLFCRAGIGNSDWTVRILWGCSTIPGLFCMYFLPFFATVYLFLSKKRGFIYVICASKALLYGFAVQTVLGTYGSSGWLMRGGFLFCDSVWMLWMYMLWQRVLSTSKWMSNMDIICGIMLCLAFSLLDYCVISPFLACLINT